MLARQSFPPTFQLAHGAPPTKRLGASPSEEPEGADDSLEDAAENEHEYLRERLREELKREPTEEELNDWLRRHTEGY